MKKMTARLGTLALAAALASLVHAADTVTPIKHVVVIFDENNSFEQIPTSPCASTRDDVCFFL
jgi:phospholipase C